MADLIDRDALLKDLRSECPESDVCIAETSCIECIVGRQPTVTAEPNRGYWIECDYKHLEHGMLETEPNAGLCCSVCRTGFQKKKMTYKKYCGACGAKMDAKPPESEVQDDY